MMTTDECRRPGVLDLIDYKFTVDWLEKELMRQANEARDYRRVLEAVARLEPDWFEQVREVLSTPQEKRP